VWTRSKPFDLTFPQDEYLSALRCAFCREPITNVMRYRRILNQVFNCHVERKFSLNMRSELNNLSSQLKKNSSVMNQTDPQKRLSAVKKVSSAVRNKIRFFKNDSPLQRVYARERRSYTGERPDARPSLIEIEFNRLLNRCRLIEFTILVETLSLAAVQPQPQPLPQVPAQASKKGNNKQQEKPDLIGNLFQLYRQVSFISY